MKLNKNTWYIVLAVVLVLVIWAIWMHNAKGPAEVNAPDNSANSEQTATSTGQNQTTGAVWLGTLQTSDNAAKGNLMLVTDKNTIYIRTSRDYSSLVGKPVKVAYQGSLDSFTLGDITAQ